MRQSVGNEQISHITAPRKQRLLHSDSIRTVLLLLNRDRRLAADRVKIGTRQPPTAFQYTHPRTVEADVPVQFRQSCGMADMVVKLCSFKFRFKKAPSFFYAQRQR